LLALQDQSGHDVSCVLRGVFTDLLNAHLLLEGARSPSGLLTMVNRLLCRSGALQDADFLTSMVAVIDHENLRMHLASAGHPPALLVRDGDVRPVPTIGGEGASGPLGVSETMVFADLTVDLRPGDGLLLYTDGLPEMPRTAGLPALTVDDLCSLARQILSEGSATGAGDLGEELLAAVSRRSLEAITPDGTNRSLDDVTIVGVDIESPAPWQTARLAGETVAAISEGIADLYATLAADWHQRGWNDADLRLRTVLAEAVVNGWEHGAGRDPQQEVAVSWQWATHFVLRVESPGGGFDLDDIDDPTKVHRRRENRGRGVYLIRELADQASWSEGGRILTAVFRRRRRRTTAASALTRTSHFHALLEPATREELSWT
jgi:anti-sigma regulatory factor (Ser/Thr protein kinase)